MTQLSKQAELDLFNIDKGPPLLLFPLPSPSLPFNLQALNVTPGG